jgi:hypothetical protein
VDDDEVGGPGDARQRRLELAGDSIERIAVAARRQVGDPVGQEPGDRGVEQGQRDRLARPAAGLLVAMADHAHTDERAPVLREPDVDRDAVEVDVIRDREQRVAA